MNIYCLDSSIGMENLLEQKPRSVILTSGTLSPIKSFTM
jgi:Rad3-related DNA helicase